MHKKSLVVWKLESFVAVSFEKEFSREGHGNYSKTHRLLYLADYMVSKLEIPILLLSIQNTSKMLSDEKRPNVSS